MAKKKGSAKTTVAISSKLLKIYSLGDNEREKRIYK